MDTKQKHRKRITDTTRIKRKRMHDVKNRVYYFGYTLQDYKYKKSNIVKPFVTDTGNIIYYDSHKYEYYPVEPYLKRIDVSRIRKYAKRYSNRLIRHNNNVLYSNSEYRRQFDYKHYVY